MSEEGKVKAKVKEKLGGENKKMNTKNKKKSKGFVAAAVLVASVVIAVVVAIMPVSVIATPEDYMFVDLSPYVNENWYDHSYSPDELQTDTTLYSIYTGTPFKIFTNDDKYRIVLNGDWGGYGTDKPSVVSINFQDDASAIHFFGHCHVGTPTTEIHAKYVIHYEDSSSIEIPLNGDPGSLDYSIDDWCCNWWNKNLTKVVVAWDGTTGIWSGSPSVPAKNPLFREFVWQNPYPDKKITTIDFIDTGTVQCPQLLAMTYKKVPKLISVTTDKENYTIGETVLMTLGINRSAESVREMSLELELKEPNDEPDLIYNSGPFWMPAEFEWSATVPFWIENSIWIPSGEYCFIGTLRDPSTEEVIASDRACFEIDDNPWIKTGEEKLRGSSRGLLELELP